MMGRMAKRTALAAFASAILLCLSSLFIVGCNEKDPPAREETPPPPFESVSILNKTDLTGVWYVGGADRKLDIALAPDYYTSANTDIAVTSSNETAVEVDETDKLKLKAAGAGTSTVTVTVNGKSDSVDITVTALSAPTVEFADDTVEKVDVYAETATPMPQIVATSCDGANLLDNVVVTPSSDKITVNKSDWTFTAAEKGEYTVTFEVADSRDNTLKSSVSLDVSAHRKVFASYYTAAAGAKLTVSGYADAEQKAQFDNDQIVLAQFNATPSKVYYAETTVTSEYDGRMLLGMTHSVKNDSSRFLTSYVVCDPLGEENAQGNGRDLNTRDIITSKIDRWDSWDGDGNRTYTQVRIGERRDIYNTENKYPVKLATVRINEFFYVFINDKYAVGYTNEYLKDKDTVPGIFGKNVVYYMTVGSGDDAKIADTAFTKMSWLTGDDAKVKFDELTDGGAILSPYVPDVGRLESKNIDNNRYTVGEYSDALGTNIDYTYDKGAPFKDGELSPYIYFDGDFEFSFEYKPTSYGKNETSGDYLYQGHRVVMEIEDLTRTSLFSLGAYFTGHSTNKDNAFLFAGSTDNKTEAFDRDADTKISENSLTFRVKREGNVFTATAIENKTVKPKEISYTLTAEEVIPVFIRLVNVGVAGKYTHIAYGMPKAEAPALRGIDIANKEALSTGVWYKNDENKTLELEFLPDGFDPTDVEYEIVSDNTDVIAVDEDNKLMLKPIGVGTATVSVMIGDVEFDSVSLTVTEVTNPQIELTGVTGNKVTVFNGDTTSLPSFAATGAGDRNLNDRVKIIASDEALGLDEATRKITPTTNGIYTVMFTVTDPRDAQKTATAELTVEVIKKPDPLDTITISNKETLTATEWKYGDGDRTLELTFSPTDYDINNTDVAIESDNTDIIAVDANNKLTIKALKVGSATITVSVGDHEYDSVQLTVKPANPTIAFDDDAQTSSFDMYIGDELAIPAFTAAACDGSDSLTAIAVTSGDGVAVDKGADGIYTVTPTAKGEHTITFEVKDRRDETKKAALAVTVNAYRKLINVDSEKTNAGKTDKLTIDAYKDDAEQTVYSSSSGNGIAAQFGLSASRKYYAEVTFRAKGNISNILLGVTHSDANADKYFVQKVFLNSDKTFGDYRVAFHDTTASGGYDFTSANNKDALYYIGNFANKYKVPASGDEKLCTVATYRDGYMFYLFVNGVVVDYCDANYGGTVGFGNIGTVPGIFFKGTDANAYADGISWLEGDDAAAKVENMINVTANNPTNSNDWYDLRGALIAAETDFYFEFTYELTETTDHFNNDRFGVLVQNQSKNKAVASPKDSLTSCIYFNGKVNTDKGLMYVKNTQKEYAQVENSNYKPKGTFTFVVKRASGMLTVSITDNGADGDNTITYSEEFTDNVMISVKSCGTVGKLTNIRLSKVSANFPQEGA